MKEYYEHYLKVRSLACVYVLGLFRSARGDVETER
jgi:hypothetical protein